MVIKTICGDLTISGEFGAWQIASEVVNAEDALQIIKLRLDASAPLPPPQINLHFSQPLSDINLRWQALSWDWYFIPPDWSKTIDSDLANNIPLMALLNNAGRNRLTFAVSEALRKVQFACGTNEPRCDLATTIKLFTDPEAPLEHYELQLRLDRRDIFYADAIAAGAQWFESFTQYQPAPVPDAAFAPLYSSWYNYHHDVFADTLEKECALAVKYGMKTIIVDDGWQCEDAFEAYVNCGEWKIAKSRFPDMRAHVKKIHDLGMRYMMWYAVPFVGFNSPCARRFAGKFLSRSEPLQTHVLDPRFPEVREFLINIYENALRDWDIDGLKLDFIDRFHFDGDDPAVAENYAGRDIKSLPAAVDRLLSDISARLRALRPDVLIEFRQNYMGPAIRKYGNMIRVSDCPGDALRNRVGSLNLRLTSGKTAVHSDMIEFNPAEPAPASALQLLNILFCVPQVSVRLAELNDEQRAMLAFWLRFFEEHAQTLLHSPLRPEHPEMNFPVVSAFGAKETIIAVYTAGQVLNVSANNRHYLVNATGTPELILDCAAAADAKIYDCCGKLTETRKLSAGLQRLPLPLAGLVEIN